MLGGCAGLPLPILNGKTVERGKKDGDFCYRNKADRVSALRYMKKEEIRANDERFLVEQIALSLFKRWIYVVQRYKKCCEIHNMPNKNCPNSLVFDVFA